MPSDPLAKLTREDWQFIAESCQQRFTKLAPKPGEYGYTPKRKESAEQIRIMSALLAMAYGQLTGKPTNQPKSAGQSPESKE